MEWRWSGPCHHWLPCSPQYCNRLTGVGPYCTDTEVPAGYEVPRYLGRYLGRYLPAARVSGYLGRSIRAAAHDSDDNLTFFSRRVAKRSCVCILILFAAVSSVYSQDTLCCLAPLERSYCVTRQSGNLTFTLAGFCKPFLPVVAIRRLHPTNPPPLTRIELNTHTPPAVLVYDTTGIYLRRTQSAVPT